MGPQALDATPLGRAAAVVRDWGDIGDGADFESSRLERPDRLLTAGTGTLDVDLDLAHAVLHRTLGRAVGRKSRRIRCALAGAFETGDAGRAPADDRTIEVCDRDDRVVECGLDVNVPLRDVLLFTPTCLDCSLAF